MKENTPGAGKIVKEIKKKKKTVQRTIREPYCSLPEKDLQRKESEN